MIAKRIGRIGGLGEGSERVLGDEEALARWAKEAGAERRWAVEVQLGLVVEGWTTKDGRVVIVEKFADGCGRPEGWEMFVPLTDALAMAARVARDVSALAAEDAVAELGCGDRHGGGISSSGGEGGSGGGGVHL